MTNSERLCSKRQDRRRHRIRHQDLREPIACALQRKLHQVTIFPGFDRIRIINLPSRPDRRAEMLRELRRVGLGDDPRVQFVDGILVEDKAPWRAPGEKGVFLAQLGIITDAAAAGESVLILEDDVDFTPAAVSWGRPDDCDIAYGGYFPADPNDLQSTDIIGAHCIGFSARAVQALAPFLERPPEPRVTTTNRWRVRMVQTTAGGISNRVRRACRRRPAPFPFGHHARAPLRQDRRAQGSDGGIAKTEAISSARRSHLWFARSHHPVAGRRLNHDRRRLPLHG